MLHLHWMLNHNRVHHPCIILVREILRCENFTFSIHTYYIYSVDPGSVHVKDPFKFDWSTYGRFCHTSLNADFTGRAQCKESTDTDRCCGTRRRLGHQ